MQGQQHQSFSISFIPVFTVSANLVPRGPTQSENSQAVAGQLLTPQVRENSTEEEGDAALCQIQVLIPLWVAQEIQGVGRRVQ